MEYVMVPVPQEHAAAVAQFLQWGIVKFPPGPWDRETTERFLAGLDDRPRAVLLAVAQAAVDGDVIPIGRAAEAGGCSEHEVLGVMMELNDAVSAAGGPTFFLATAVIEGSTETGLPSWSLNMLSDIARPFVEAAGRTPDRLE